MRALVVGADGFVGRWLVRHLAEVGDDVVGLVGARYQPPLEGASAVHAADVRELPAVAAVVRDAAPEALYYLAAVSAAGRRERVLDAVGIGVSGAVNALAACAEEGRPVRFLFVSSAHVYGDAGPAHVTESAPLRPRNVYGAAKAAAEAALLQLAPVTPAELLIARPFNHIGPGQQAPFLVPQLDEQLRNAGGADARISVGAPDMVRDYTDVRDVVRAYRLLVEHGEAATVYNVASGQGRSVTEVFDALVAAFGARAELLADPAIDRSGDVPVLVGDAARLRSLGWHPTYALDRTLSDVVAAG